QPRALILPALAPDSSPALLRRLPRVINALRVGFDLRQREPRRFEFALGIKRGLIEVMRRIRIGALAEDENRTRLGLRPELHHADKRIALCAVTPLAPFHLHRVEGEDHAQIRWPARDRQTRTLIAELLRLAAGANTLQLIDLTPGHTPRAEVPFQFTHRSF